MDGEKKVALIGIIFVLSVTTVGIFEWYKMQNYYW